MQIKTVKHILRPKNFRIKDLVFPHSPKKRVGFYRSFILILTSSKVIHKVLDGNN
jgi:hypothetical protein